MHKWSRNPKSGYQQFMYKITKVAVLIASVWPVNNVAGKSRGSVGKFSDKVVIYHEDLSKYRSLLSGSAVVKKSSAWIPTTSARDITESLNTALRQRRAVYDRVSYIRGYTIQAYMGNNRIKAMKVKDKVNALLPQYVSELKYREPNYTVQVGFFEEESDANYVYFSLLGSISDLIIRPFTIKKNRYITDLMSSSN